MSDSYSTHTMRFNNEPGARSYAASNKRNGKPGTKVSIRHEGKTWLVITKTPHNTPSRDYDP